MSELKPWLDRILAAQSSEEVFAILDEFRPLLWSDDERAAIARFYNAKLYQMRMSQGADISKPAGKISKVKGQSNISKQNAGNQRGEAISSSKELDEDEVAV